MINESEIRAHLEIVHDAAAKLATGLSRTGVLQLARKHPLVDGMAPTRFRIGDVDGMTLQAVADASSGHDVYIEIRSIRSDLKGQLRGTADDAAFHFAIWVDDDGNSIHDIPYSLAVESSPGRRHLWILFDRPVAPSEANDLSRRLHAYAGVNGSITDPPRLAGTLNRKQPDVRLPVPVRLLETSDRRFSPDELRALFPAVAHAATDDSEAVDRAVTKRDLLDCAAALKWIPADDYEDWKNIGLALVWAARRAAIGSARRVLWRTV